MSRKFFKNRKQLGQAPLTMLAGRNERRFKKKKVPLIFLVAGLSVSGVVCFFAYAPFFRINKVAIKGINEAENFSAVQLAVQQYTEGFQFGILPKNNILLLNKNKLARSISEKAPVEEVVVRKKARTLEIEGQEKLPVLIWQEGAQDYYIDKKGWVMAAVDKNNIKYDLPVINRATTTVVTVGEQIIDPESVDFIQVTREKIKQIWRGWSIKKVEVKDFSNRAVNFYTTEGWYLILDVKGDTDEALINLANFLRQDGLDSKKLQYVDLRIPDKIFYK